MNTRKDIKKVQSAIVAWLLLDQGRFWIEDCLYELYQQSCLRRAQDQTGRWLYAACQ